MIFIKKTEDNGRHYLYQHIRLDKETPFYVGVGTKYNHNKDYTRSKTKNKRNRLWRNIVKKTEYRIEIIFENDDYTYIKEREIELIEKYGQVIKNTGPLCNLTDGGDGLLGIKQEKLMKPVFLYEKTGMFYKVFNSYSDCAKFLSVKRVSVSSVINKDLLLKGFIVKSHYDECVKPILDIKEKLKHRLSKVILQLDLNGVLIKEWGSSSEASRCLKIHGGHIRECALGKRKTAGNFIWKYF